MIPWLARPAWPLVKTLCLLILSAPEEEVRKMLGELPPDLEVGELTYPDPEAALLPHVELLNLFRNTAVKGEDPGLPPLAGPSGQALDPLEQIQTWVKQGVLERELEVINSLLCGRRRCTLCCTGPSPQAEHHFFEIPLKERELGLFPETPIHDDPASRRSTPYDPQELTIRGRPFYQVGPVIVRWKRGWGLILGRCVSCPHLDREGRCAIYSARPMVCRKPQIFPYIIEEQEDGSLRAANTLLAVTDCPYVREEREAIERYAALCEAELVYRANKR